LGKEGKTDRAHNFLFANHSSFFSTFVWKRLNNLLK